MHTARGRNYRATGWRTTGPASRPTEREAGRLDRPTGLPTTHAARGAACTRTPASRPTEREAGRLDRPTGPPTTHAAGAAARRQTEGRAPVPVPIRSGALLRQMLRFEGRYPYSPNT